MDADEAAAPSPPVARREPVTITQHGRERVDEYAWMRDPDWQRVLRDPSLLRGDIRAHLDAENAYAAAVLRGTEALTDTLVAEMISRIRDDDDTVPLPDGAYEYYRRFRPGAQHPLLARRPRGVAAVADGEVGPVGAEEILLDADAEARASAFFRLGDARHSPDGTLFAFAADRVGSEVYGITVRRIADGAAVGAPIENSAGEFVFSPDGTQLFWVFRDDNGRPSRLYRRPVGGDAAGDVLVHDEADPGLEIGVAVTGSRRFVVIAIGNRDQSEAWVVPGDRPTASPRLVAAREPGVRYEVDHWSDRFVILTDAFGATDYAVMEAPEDDPSRANWRVLVPHVPGRYITAIRCFRDHLVRAERVDADDRVVVRTRADGSERVVDGGAVSVVGFTGGHEYDTATLRISIETPREPQAVYDLDMRDGARRLRKRQVVPRGHDPADYVTRRLLAPAADGALVPITLLALRETLRDGHGPAPVFLYGYGAYGFPVRAGFSTRPFNLVDRGWIYSVAHVRGGSEKGWSWFLDGRRERKTNSFSDFVACAEHLIATGHAAPGRIVAYGASAGGLLMGAVLNLRPDLWAGVAAGVPFVDVLNTMSDPSLPLTPGEWPEWGDPITDVAAYDRIASWSPYDQVTAQAYPPVLVVGGLADPRVTYWEPAKWVARLRAANTTGAPMLLRTNMGAGHGGPSGRYAHLREPASIDAFALWVITLGSSEPG